MINDTATFALLCDVRAHLLAMAHDAVSGKFPATTSSTTGAAARLHNLIDRIDEATNGQTWMDSRCGMHPHRVWPRDSRYEELQRAASQLYLRAHWTTTMLPLDEQVQMWERLRRALAIEHDQSPKPN